MRAASTCILAVAAFLTSSLFLGAAEGYVRGYWPESMFEGEARWALWLFEEWWLYSGRRLLPASIIALILHRFVVPRVRAKWHIAPSWWFEYSALLACFAVSTIPAVIWGYAYAMPIAFALSVGVAGGALKLEGRPMRAAV